MLCVRSKLPLRASPRLYSMNSNFVLRVSPGCQMHSNTVLLDTDWQSSTLNSSPVSISASIIKHGVYLNFHSILFRITRDSDLDDWADLCKSTDPPQSLRIIMVTGWCILSAWSSCSSKSMINIADCSEAFMNSAISQV